MVLGAPTPQIPHGHLVEIIDVPVPHPRSADQLLTPRFLATRRRIEELIHGGHAKSTSDKLPMIKMTQAGDEVV